jgi:hypothetical protein
MAELDATIGGTTANSYVTIVRASEILEDSRLRATAWTEAPGGDEDRDAALQWATRLIDTYFEFEGNRRKPSGDDKQALSWPRYSAYDIDEVLIPYDEIPYRVEWATAELALELLTRDRSAEPGLLGLGFREARVGSLMVKVDPQETPDLVPDSINAILYPIGTPSAAASMGKGTYSARVNRT